MSAIAQATEFKDIRFKSGEKPAYKGLNKSPYIRFSIPVNLDLAAHKVSLIIQAQLGAVDIAVPNDRARTQYNTDSQIINNAVPRLIRCLVDLQTVLGDSVALCNALMLCRSLGARCWDDSPSQMRQLENIGPVAVRKLVQAGIRSLEELETAEPHQIEVALGRNKPFGHKLLALLRLFPKLHVTIQVVGRPVIKAKQGATVRCKAEVGFMNDTPPSNFCGKPVYVVFLAETSDGRLVGFARLGAAKIGNGEEINFTADLTSPSQLINCYVMCDEFAGTMQSASLHPTVPSIAWPDNVDEVGNTQGHPTVNRVPPSSKPSMNMARKRNDDPRVTEPVDEFGDDDIADDDMVQALNSRIVESPRTESLPVKRAVLSQSAVLRKEQPTPASQQWQPKILPNGKWACNHRCKDKKVCKHLCCREGSDKPPKQSTKHVGHTNDVGSTATAQRGKEANKLPKGQTQLSLTTIKKVAKPMSADGLMAWVDLTETPKTITKKQDALAKPSSAAAGRRLGQTLEERSQAPNRTFPSNKDSSKELPRKKPLIMPDSDDMDDSLPEVADHIMAQDRRIDPDDMNTDDLLALRSDAPSEYCYDDDMIDDVMIGLADSEELKQSAKDSARASRSDLKRNELDRASLAREEGLSKVKPARILPKHLTKQTEGSDESALFVQSSSDASRAAQTHHENEDHFPLPPSKKVRREHQDESNDSPVAIAQDTEIREVEGGKESKEQEVEPWFLQEFGKYVDFI